MHVILSFTDISDVRERTDIILDPIIAEKQLKKRAQLRMKLAAEKRVLLSGHNEG